MEQHEFTNRLIGEKSPYLLQHAHNPIDWYPWGNEAFRAAKERDLPIFLSIGYATCHWCHVMEQESFRDIEVALAMNTTFVNIKVDREEMPEVDSLYMEFAQSMMLGATGWPLNLILTPDLKPFFAATYLPKHSARGLVGLIELTEKIHTLWEGEERSRLLAHSEKIVELVEEHIHAKGTDLPKKELILGLEEIFFRVSDPVFGGIQGAPKFPLGYQANFLLKRYLQGGDSRALFIVERTLDMMRRGGIHDHLGGGFSRYSVDEKWLVPHFEKMLYDNAILALAYLEAWRVTGANLYKEVVEDIFSYVARDLKGSEGAFYCAEDADIDGVEGLFYTWTSEEVIELLGEEVGRLIVSFFAIGEGLVGERSVLSTPITSEEFAAHQGLNRQDWENILQEAKTKLFVARNARQRPFRDTKIITSWNGLMVRVLAEAGMFLGEEKYLLMARECADFLKTTMWRDNRLYRRYADGEVAHEATLEDFSYLISGLLSLFEATGSAEIFQWILSLTSCLERNFKDLSGAFYEADSETEHLIIKKTRFSDGAEPSGNSVHAENLIRLYQITSNEQFLEQAEDIFRAAQQYVETYPLGYCYYSMALMRYFDQKKSCIFLVPGDNTELISFVWSLIARHAILHHVSVIVSDDRLRELSSVFRDKIPINGKTTVYICHEGRCLEPLVDSVKIQEALKKI